VHVPYWENPRYNDDVHTTLVHVGGPRVNGGRATCHVDLSCFSRDPWRKLVPRVEWYEFHMSCHVEYSGRDTCHDRWLLMEESVV
jgi:hypothetical protein